MDDLDVGSNLEGGKYHFLWVCVLMRGRWVRRSGVFHFLLFFFWNNICHWTWHLFVQINWPAGKSQRVSYLHSLALLLQADTTMSIFSWVLMIQCCSPGLSSTVWKPVCTVRYYVVLNMHGFLTHLPEFQWPQSFNDCPLKEGDKGE